MDEKSIQNNAKVHRNTTSSLCAMKLTVALELHFEGYTQILFDRTFAYAGRKVHVHVLAEDALGFKVAALCFNGVRKIVPNEVMEVVDLVERALGEDCEVVIAIPLGLLAKAKDIVGLTNRIFAVDTHGRVWIHNVGSRRSQAVLSGWNAIEDSEDPVETTTKVDSHNHLTWPVYVV